MKDDIAILTDDNFAIIRKDTRMLEVHKHNINSYTDISILIENAMKYDVTNIWITPFSDIAGKFTPSVLETTKEYGVKGTRLNEDETYVMFTRGYKRNGSNDICITIPEFNPLWQFNEYEDISPNDLALMLVSLRDTLGISIFNSPTKAGIELLEHVTPNSHMAWLRATDFEMSDEIPIATSIVWRNENKIAPKKYLHVYDKKGAFLSSYQSCLLGAGNAKHVKSIPFDKSKIGLWRVNFSGSSIYNGSVLPLPYNEHTDNNLYWTQEVNIAAKLGYEVEVQEAHIWEEAHYIFREWSKLIWDSREFLKQEYETKGKFGYKLAYDTVKRIYTKTGGRIAHRNTNEYANKDIYQRFDWFSMIVSDTRLKVLVQVDKLVKLGYYPIMIVTDALYYLSDDKDYKTAIPTIMDREGLGSYAHKYSTEYENVRELFDSGYSANQIAEKLNQLERNGETW